MGLPVVKTDCRSYGVVGYGSPIPKTLPQKVALRGDSQDPRTIFFLEFTSKFMIVLIVFSLFCECFTLRRAHLEQHTFIDMPIVTTSYETPLDLVGF